ncbi:MAG: TIM44-like domain-containing protein [Beijerinckiaceae bacterium]
MNGIAGVNTSNLMKRMGAVLAIALMICGQTVTPVDARPGDGGSMGSRGSKTFSAPPATNTAPGGAAPMQRSITQPTPSSPSMGGQAPMQQPAAAPSFGRSLLGGLAGGFLGAGLFGMLSGSGFMGGMGGFMSMIGLVFQALLVVGLIYLVVSLFRKSRQQPAYAEQGYARSPVEMMPAAGGAGVSGGAAVSGGAGVLSAPLQIGDSDYAAFEKLLSAVQDAYSREDLSALRGLATPEMVSYFGDDLARNSQKGLVDSVTQVKLLQGDLAESWTESGSDYASVAMRFSFINAMIERASNRVVSGDPNQVQEATEIWTFRRASGGTWMLSAIQQTH